ncbi:histidine utilization repressor [Caldimonas tepidiphila]|uniref:histidine utilization repressor n=1 Tax=Caldimonas tepidiphila TaxID=2315841 RepID=UPI000E5BB055|nr:histidine utilization repressor [Caldimonas tepidiphila]
MDQAREARPAAYRRIKEHILARIRAGNWKEGDAIPSEQALAAEFGVSRMTANRALRELSDEQVLVRVQGSGTFVAPPKSASTLLEIRSIAEEIAARGHRHRAELQRLERVRAGGALAAQFGLAAGAPLFHSVVVHYENELPIQVEDRHVNPALAPDYLGLDFGRTTANEHLMRVAPLEGVHFRIEARLPPPEVAAMLHIDARQPCLVLSRRTRSRGQVASVATLWHPADRYQFTGGF